MAEDPDTSELEVRIEFSLESRRSQAFISSAKDGDWETMREILGRHPGYVRVKKGLLAFFGGEHAAGVPTLWCHPPGLLPRGRGDPPGAAGHLVGGHGPSHQGPCEMRLGCGGRMVRRPKKWCCQRVFVALAAWIAATYASGLSERGRIDVALAMALLVAPRSGAVLYRQ